jgi:creatinine amidohydrolase
MIVGDGVFAETIAELTWYEADQAAKSGAIVLWAFGVIEQHGPHLPTGTDVYLPSARLRRVKQVLAERGVASVIVPPYYWGVNHASASFPASFKVRPEIMVELVCDVFASLAGDGYKRVFCTTGHGDSKHNLAIHAAARRSALETKMDISFLADEGLIKRLNIDLSDPNVTPVRTHSEPRKFPDIHAGRNETSAMLEFYPNLVRQEKIQELRSVDFSMDQLAEWRKGHEFAKRLTPLGYVGNPGQARLEEGVRDNEASVLAMVEAIHERIKKAKGFSGCVRDDLT